MVTKGYNPPPTSREAYERIKTEGLLSQLRFEVYEALFDHGPATAGELWDRFFNGRQRSSVSARMRELERFGVIRERCTRACGLTGKTAIVWEITGDLPRSVEKVEGVASMTRNQLIDEIDRLKEVILGQNRQRGYPTGIEWMAIVREFENVVKN